MALVTEAMLREQFGGPGAQAPAEYRVPAGTIVTPSARAWLADRRIGLAFGEAERSALPAFAKPERYELASGGSVTAKPEHLTALRGNVLVPKDHPVIRLRGALDSLEADILCAQVAFRRLRLAKGVAELGEVLRFVKQILRAEVLDEPLGPIALLGLDEAGLRARSHAPREFYGIGHFAASVDDGEAVVTLNALRTKSREVELAAYEAFKADAGRSPDREDVILALNRLSSAFYIMMFKAKTKEYQG
jgi:ethanolamine utilization cobalamin adenosyltransferase